MNTIVVLTMLTEDYNDLLISYIAPMALVTIGLTFFRWMGVWEKYGLYISMMELALFKLTPMIVLFVVVSLGFGLALAVMDFYRL